MRIDKARWRPSVKRTTGWYGKQRITNGHRNYNGTGFHQLLSLNKNTRADYWGNKIKGW
jgi:hypothetical protein